MGKRKGGREGGREGGRAYLECYVGGNDVNGCNENGAR